MSHEINADTMAPYIHAAIAWIRDEHIEQSRARNDACFVRDALYQAPEIRRARRRIFSVMRRPDDGSRLYTFLAEWRFPRDPSDDDAAALRRFYSFLRACLLCVERAERRARRTS